MRQKLLTKLAKVLLKLNISPLRSSRYITYTLRSLHQYNLQCSYSCSHSFHKGLGKCPHVDTEGFHKDSIEKTNETISTSSNSTQRAFFPDLI